MDEETNIQLKLEGELSQLQKELADLKARWPAHSVKPAMLIQLEELEEKIEQLNFQLSRVTKM